MLRALPLLLLLIVTPAAQAATVTRATETFDAQGGETVVDHTVTVAASPGEANALAVTAERGTIVVHDDGAPLTAGTGCAAVDPAAVRCSAPRRGDVTRIEAVVRLGDGDDRATIAPALLATVEGGDGADTITSPGIIEGGAGDDRITGTAGDEGMAGGPGADVLTGLGGDDDMIGDTEPQDGSRSAPEGDDVLDGGPGRDGVLYPARTIPVAIDLGAGTAGSEGERDTLIGIEDATGGSGPDTITGTPGANHLNGFGGRDVIRALDGDDVVEGGGDVDAGTGDDRLVFPRGTYDCGSGSDVVATPPRRAPVPDACELVELDLPLAIASRPRVDRSLQVAFVTTCRCRYRGRVTVTRAGVVLARGRVRVPRAPRGGTARVTIAIALTPSGAREARPGTEVTVTFRSRAVATAPFRTRLAAR